MKDVAVARPRPLANSTATRRRPDKQKMSTKRITRITVESERVVVLNRHQKSFVAWCVECQAKTPMLKPEEAAAIAGVTPRTIYRWIEMGRLHFTESSDGWLLVCLQSLLSHQV
jgi:hypothetical protein